MSDGERLLLFLALIYLSDCLLWVDRRTVLFASGTGGRWRAVVADYLWGNSSGRLLRPVCSLGKTFLAFALLHFVLQGQTYLLLQASLDFLLLHSSLL